VVQIVARIAAAVQPNIAPADAFGVDEPALVGLGVVLFLAHAQSCRVVDIVVEYRTDVRNKIGIVGDLDNHVEIDSRLFMVVPHHDGIDIVHCFEVDSYMLS